MNFTISADPAPAQKPGAGSSAPPSGAGEITDGGEVFELLLTTLSARKQTTVATDAPALPAAPLTGACATAPAMPVAGAVAPLALRPAETVPANEGCDTVPGASEAAPPAKATPLAAFTAEPVARSDPPVLPEPMPYVTGTMAMIPPAREMPGKAPQEPVTLPGALPVAAPDEGVSANAAPAMPGERPQSRINGIGTDPQDTDKIKITGDKAAVRESDNGPGTPCALPTPVIGSTQAAAPATSQDGADEYSASGLTHLSDALPTRAGGYVTDRRSPPLQTPVEFAEASPPPAAKQQAAVAAGSANAPARLASGDIPASLNPPVVTATLAPDVSTPPQTNAPSTTSLQFSSQGAAPGTPTVQSVARDSLLNSGEPSTPGRSSFAGTSLSSDDTAVAAPPPAAGNGVSGPAVTRDINRNLIAPAPANSPGANIWPRPGAEATRESRDAPAREPALTRSDAASSAIADTADGTATPLKVPTDSLAPGGPPVPDSLVPGNDLIPSPPSERDIQSAGPQAPTAEARAAPQFPTVPAQIANAALKLDQNGFELSLSPDELGKVRLSLSTGDGNLTVHIHAERPETMDLLRRNLGELARDFRDLGLGTATFSFSQENDQSAAHRQQSPAVSPFGGSDFSLAPQNAAESTPRILNGSLDLRL